MEGWFDPVGVAGVGEDLFGEFEDAAEFAWGFEAVHVEEVGGGADFKAVHAQQPLVDFGLAFVGVFVGAVQGDFRGGGGAFVVHDVEFAAGVDPKVIHGSGDEQVGRSV